MQDDKFGLLVMRGCGGRGVAALLAWMVALLFFNTNEADMRFLTPNDS